MFRWLRYLFKRRLTSAKAVVRYETPWYIRALCLIVAFGLGVVAMSMIYHLRDGTNIRLTSDEHTEKALAECQASMQNNAQLNEKIEQAQFVQLSEQIEKLQSEKTQLKEDLAVCNRLSNPSRKPGETQINELELQQISPGVYRYNALISHTASQTATTQDDIFEGNLFLSVDLAKSGKTIVIAGQNGILSPPIDLKIKHFERFSGTFNLPPNQKIQLFRARIRKNGRVIDTRTTANITTETAAAQK